MEDQQTRASDALSGLHWTEILSVALQEKAKGNLAEALRLCEECARLHADDPGGRGWALFNLFFWTMEAKGQEAAVPFSLEILNLGSNLASKLYVASAAIDFYLTAADKKRAREVAAALSNAIAKWRLSHPASDDIALPLAAQVINQIAQADLADAAPELRFELLDCDHPIVASIATAYSDRKFPRLYNALSPQMTTYLQGKGAEGRLGIRIADNVTLARCGEYAYAFDSEGQLLPIFYDQIPHFYKSKIETMVQSIENIRTYPRRIFLHF